VSNPLLGATRFEDQGMTRTRGAPRHPQDPREIERWHQTLKNRILLEHYYLPGALEEQVGAFVEHYNHARAHESLSNLTPPTSTSAGARPSWPNGSGSRNRP
jgi:transposase InsO family protein